MTLTAAELRRESRRLAALAREAEQAEAAAILAAREARKPTEPDVGSTVRFSKATGGRIYDYAARSFALSPGNRRWAITNTVTGVEGRYTWNGLLEFIGEANWLTLEIATGWTPLVDPDDEPAVVERVAPYGRVTATENVEPWHGQAGEQVRSPFGPRR